MIYIYAKEIRTNDYVITNSRYNMQFFNYVRRTKTSGDWRGVLCFGGLSVQSSCGFHLLTLLGKSEC